MPPSVDKTKCTFAQETREAVVLATSHVIISLLPGVQISLSVLGAVTKNGPELPSAWKATSLYAPPPFALLSLTNNRKYNLGFR